MCAKAADGKESKFAVCIVGQALLEQPNRREYWVAPI